jgi:hypothetical protein
VEKMDEKREDARGRSLSREKVHFRIHPRGNEELRVDGMS